MRDTTAGQPNRLPVSVMYDVAGVLRGYMKRHATSSFVAAGSFEADQRLL